MELLYMLIATFLVSLFFILYVVLTKFIRLRGVTARRLLLFGSLVYMAVVFNGGAILWMLAIGYGMYLVVATILGAVYGIFSGKGGMISTIITVATGYLATDNVINRYKDKK